MIDDWSRLDEVPYYFVRSCVKFQDHTGRKIADFEQNLALLDCNSIYNGPMAMKWGTKLEVAYKRCPIVLKGHLSNFKVTWDRKSSILTWIESFQIVTPVWIYWCFWKKCTKRDVGGALLFFINLISRSYRMKNRPFESSLSKITRLVAAIESLIFALYYIKEVFWIL